MWFNVEWIKGYENIYNLLLKDPGFIVDLSVKG